MKEKIKKQRFKYSKKFISLLLWELNIFMWKSLYYTVSCLKCFLAAPLWSLLSTCRRVHTLWNVLENWQVMHLIIYLWKLVPCDYLGWFFFLSTAHLESLLRFPSLKTPLFIIRTEWCKAGVGLIKFWSRTPLLPRGKSFQTVHLKSSSRSV